MTFLKFFVGKLEVFYMQFIEKVKELVQSYQTCEFVLMNRGIMKEIGVNQTLVLSELLSRLNYHASKNELDKDNSFFCTTEKLEELTTLGYKAQTLAIKTLESLGLIKVVRKNGNKRYFIVILDAVKSLIEKFSKTVKPKEENQDCQKGNYRNDEKENPELPKGKNSNYKKEFIKPKNKNNNKIQNNNSLSSSSSSEKKVNEEKGMDYIFKITLEEFLESKGFSALLIKQTAKAFVEKGITMFKMSQLQDAYNKMIYYHKNVKPVLYPSVFLANGMAMSFPVHEQKRVEVEPEDIEVPFYNWLEA
jgi:hypothetical protein